MKGFAIAATVLALTLAVTASAQPRDLALWTFQVSVPATAGPHTPESGAYAFVGVSAARSCHADPSTAYDNPTGNGSTESFSSNYWGIGDYYEFKTRTAGYQGITIAWDQTRSSTGPTTFSLDYSTDGNTFTNLVPSYTVLSDPNGWSQSTRIMTDVFGPDSAPAVLNNQATVYFRLTNLVAPGSGGGTNRVDNVEIQGTAQTGVTGACCISGSCTADMSPDACANAGGNYKGNNQACVPNLCVANSGACCQGTTCLIQLPAECATAGGVYKGDGTACSPNPCLFDMTIAQAKTCSAGTPVRIANVVVSSTFDLVNSWDYMNFHVQDATGGMTVFGQNADIGALLGVIGEGDRTTLEGSMVYYNCLAEFVAPYNTPSVLGHVAPNTIPIVVHASDFADGSLTAEGLESTLVRVNCLRTAATGNWGYNSYYATDSTGTLVIRIATNQLPLVTTPIPTGSFDMIGIFSQFDAGGTCVTGYQLQPRYLSDVILEPPEICPIVGACCVGEICAITTQAGCSGGGVWHGRGTTCTPNPCVGACCLNGACSLTLAAACTTPSIFLGNESECLVGVCPTPVHSGDLALGLNDGRPWVTAQQIRDDGTGHGYQVGAWSSEAFLQSMEFDSLGGLQHNHAGNLLAVDFGAGGGAPLSPPSCTDANRPEEGAKLFSLKTDGSNGGQLLWDFNSQAGNPNPHSAECTRGGGLSVSPDNLKIAFWGTDTKHLYVLGYTPATGLRTPGSISAEYIYAGLVGGLPNTAGTIGTTWYSSSTILVHCASYVLGKSMLYSVDFSGGVFSNLVLRATLYHGEAGSGTIHSFFTDVEYNPTVSPYVYCMFSDLFGGVSYTYLDVLDPADWSHPVKQISIGANYLDPNTPVASCNTGREIALGPDGYLYISQYAGSGVPRPYVDRLDTANVATWGDDSSVDYYVMSSSPVYAAYVGLDVAFGLPGACCDGTNCIGEFYEQFCIAHYGGTFKGEGVLCASNPCVPNGACCTPAGTCTQTTQAACLSPNVWHGEWTSCTPNACPQPPGACCLGTVCSIQLPADCATAGGVYKGNGTACSPNPCLFDMTIAQAKTYAWGTPVRIANVTVSSTFDLIYSPNYMNFHVQDATGGMTVWGTNADIGALLGYIGEGDRTTLEGTLNLYSCLMELVAPFNTPSVLGHPGVPAPIVVHACDFADGSPTAEAYESKLVRVNCLTTTATGNWAHGFNYTATDSAGAMIIYIATFADTLIGTPIPTGPFDMVGIFSQYDPSGTCVQGYELLPRKFEDLTLDTNCIPSGACCLGETCSITTQAGCTGVWQGQGTTCTPTNPCPQPQGACCLSTGECLVLPKSECWANPGAIWRGAGTNCTDTNLNGMAGICETCGDLNNDGTVDYLDYWIMLDAFGRCAPDARYAAAVAMDVNHNDCIDLVDYQAWFTCYRMANGQAFVPPAPPPPQPPPKPPAQLTPLSEAAPVLVKPAQKAPATLPTEP